MTLRLGKGTPVPYLKSKPRADTILAVPFRYQEQTQWCWAACAEMIYHFFGITNWRQCHMAQVIFGADCCSAPGSSVCNQPNWVSNALNLVGIHWYWHNTAYSFYGVRNEINGSRPVVARYGWSGGGGHFVVIRGYYDDTDLDVHDPWYGPGRRTYDSILNAYGMGNWDETYTGISR
jgi:hypothetical protein